MSTTEIQRFTADLNNNAALRKEVESTATEAANAAVIALAVSKGYGVTVEQLRTAAVTAGKVLADTELDGVAGGSRFSPGDFTQIPINIPVNVVG